MATFSRCTLGIYGDWNRWYVVHEIQSCNKWCWVEQSIKYSFSSTAQATYKCRQVLLVRWCISFHRRKRKWAYSTGKLQINYPIIVVEETLFSFSQVIGERMGISFFCFCGCFSPIAKLLPLLFAYGCCGGINGKLLLHRVQAVAGLRGCSASLTSTGKGITAMLSGILDLFTTCFQSILTSLKGMRLGWSEDNPGLLRGAPEGYLYVEILSF